MSARPVIRTDKINLQDAIPGYAAGERMGWIQREVCLAATARHVAWLAGLIDRYELKCQRIVAGALSHFYQLDGQFQMQCQLTPDIFHAPRLYLPSGTDEAILKKRMLDADVWLYPEPGPVGYTWDVIAPPEGPL